MAGYLRQMALREVVAEGNGAAESRVSGLHAGWYWIAEDFDAPLPESFWLGAEGKTEETDSVAPPDTGAYFRAGRFAASS